MAKRTHGFTIIEALVGSAILGLGLTALFTHWVGVFNRYTKAREVAQAGQLARAEVERAKVYGTANLPLGTYASSTNTATWTGAFDPGTGGWVTSGSTYYDRSGNRVASAAASGVRYKLQATISDTGLLTKSTGYAFQMQSERAFAVTVTLVPEGSVVAQMGTNIVPGGL
ncbi:type II secretion system protein [bacterium]|nr:MAG: type II secretion system protein [bacterium]